MQYWLVKSDPDEYSLADLEREGTTAWTGVRNYQARNYLRQMSVGDRVLVYHSGAERAVVGTAQVVRPAYPDPTAESDEWVCVDLRFERKLPRAVSLETIKATPTLRTLLLLKQSRLSVMPVTKEEYEEILRLAAA
ncbi:MAG: EVE domain-containing protein [Bacteroidota bacterium]|nr:EVE domain-containing protein [Bacteroidota bacterium]